MSMDFDSDILRVQARIDQILGVQPQDDWIVPPVDNAPQSGRFASMVQQALGNQQGAPAFAPLPPAQIDSLVQSSAATWGVDPDLIRAVMANESAFNPNATSKAGAQGLMQLMPETAASLGVTNGYDPEQNVWGGTRYLRSMLDRFGGDLTKAIAAYNAGPNAVERYGGVPPYAETQAYVENVLDSYQQYKNAQQSGAPQIDTQR
jgi:soluble lytic murein transglycosylase-like protein